MSLRRLAGSWLLIAIAMTANGAFREGVLRPMFGQASADLTSTLIGAAIILLATRRLLRPLEGATFAHLSRASALLVALTVAFEFGVGRFVDGKSWDELLADYEIWNGRLWPALLLLVAISPFIWGRWASRRSVHAR